MMIQLGAVGELKEMTGRGNTNNRFMKKDPFALGVRNRPTLYKFIGVQDGFHVRHYVFQLVGGTYKTCISETDFMCGYYHFTGSPETMRPRRRTKKALEPADLYCNTSFDVFTGRKPNRI
jgi:hypothetical protein